ncbi:hypothetical protein LR066_02600 [candidate division WOR-3 bacterium]|nr:hypothetical protein [candidate division WOR-3 bacterium]
MWERASALDPGQVQKGFPTVKVVEQATPQGYCDFASSRERFYLTTVIKYVIIILN